MGKYSLASVEYLLKLNSVPAFARTGHAQKKKPTQFYIKETHAHKVTRRIKVSEFIFPDFTNPEHEIFKGWEPLPFARYFICFDDDTADARIFGNVPDPALPVIGEMSSRLTLNAKDHWFVSWEPTEEELKLLP